MNPTEIPIILAALASAAILGATIGYRPRPREYEWDVMRACAFLGVAGALMMRVIDDEIARAFGLMGAASIVRYRYSLRSGQDATALVLALAVGLACGQQMWILAAIGTATIAALNGLFAVFVPAAVPLRQTYEIEIRTSEGDVHARAAAFFASHGLEARLTEVESKDRKEKGAAYKFVYVVRSERADAPVIAMTGLHDADVGEVHVRELSQS